MKKTQHYIFAMALIIAFTRPAFAVDRYWANTGTDFNAGASWTGGTAPSSADRAFFSTSLATQPNVSAPRTLYGLFFTPALGTTAASATSACGGYVLGGASGTALTLTASAFNYNGVFMMEQCTTGTNVISANLSFPNETSIKYRQINLVSGTLEISGGLAGDSNTVVRLAGSSLGTTFILSGDNSGFAGGFARAAALPVIIKNAQALSKTTRLEFLAHAGTTLINNKFVNQTAGPLVFESNPSMFLSGGDGVLFESDHPIDFGSGSVTFNDSIAGRNCPLIINAPLVKFGGPTVQTLSNNGYFKRGPGTLELGGASSYLGVTTVADGVLLAKHAQSISPLSALNITRHNTTSVAGGIIGLAYGDFTNAVGLTAGCFYTQNSGGYSPTGGWAAYGGNRNVNIGNNLQPVTNTLPFLENITLGSATADGTVSFLNPLNTKSATWYAYDGAADVDGRFSGAITNYSTTTPTISKYGNGTLELSANNPLTGTINMYEGKLRVSGSLKTTLNVKAGGTLEGAGTMSGAVVVETNGTFAVDNQVGAATLQGNLTFNAGAKMTITLNGNTTPGINFTGASKIIRNYGTVSCLVQASNSGVTSGTLKVIDWTSATSPTVSNLNPALFSIANPDAFSGTFEIQGTSLVLKYRNLEPKPTVIVVL